MITARSFLIWVTLLAFYVPAPSQTRHQQITNDVLNAFQQLELKLEQSPSNDSIDQALPTLLIKVKTLLGKCLSTLSSEEYYGSAKKKTIDRYYNELDNYRSIIDGTNWLIQLDSLSKTLYFMEEDLSLKYDTSSSAGPSRSGLVKLRVRVLDPQGNRELRGYHVFVKPEISLDPRLIENFNPTNNAIKEIVPGRKLIWIEKNGQRLAQRKEGIRKSDRPLMVDFILPEPVPER